ncbi:hypothetical protein BKA65DRAFT_246960 [Rhexocercosporidium sp. MPI-PUGE-AT-0058]|nr:hypothetical protein BKA65DRAFT_246960 [Rhexocercosporidium sp. MPI-PUGE-AT-0058]
MTRCDDSFTAGLRTYKKPPKLSLPCTPSDIILILSIMSQRTGQSPYCTVLSVLALAYAARFPMFGRTSPILIALLSTANYHAYRMPATPPPNAFSRMLPSPFLLLVPFLSFPFLPLTPPSGSSQIKVKSTLTSDSSCSLSQPPRLIPFVCPDTHRRIHKCHVYLHERKRPRIILVTSTVHPSSEGKGSRGAARRLPECPPRCLIYRRVRICFPPPPVLPAQDQSCRGSKIADRGASPHSVDIGNFLVSEQKIKGPVCA